MSTALLAGLVGAGASLILAIRAMRAEGRSFKGNAWMAVTWAVIITALAVFLSR